LHQRIRELEDQTIAGSHSGPLTNRVDALEKAIHGTGTVAPKPTKTASHTAKAAKLTKSVNAPHKPVPTTTSVYMPPIAPHFDPGATQTTTASSAEETTRSAVPANTAEVDEMLRKGTAAFQNGRTDEAEKAFRDALIKSPFNSNASFNLGAIAESKGDLAGALGNYRTALIGAPNDRQIQEAIAQVESQIAAQANSPFKNPIARTANGGTILQGNASDFGLSGATNGGILQGQTAQIPPIPNGIAGGMYPANAYAGAGNGQNGSAPGQAPRQITMGAKLRSAGVEYGAALARIGIRSAMGGGFNPMTAVGALHCPICRLLH
jgi:tetratricopeptide (TPR) repeat protein